MREILVDTAARLFQDLCTNRSFEIAEKGGLDTAAWSSLEAAGLTRATLSEERGGDGADLGDAVALVRECGRVSLPLPFAETLLAELALAAAGLPPQDGVGTIGPTVKGAGSLVLVQVGNSWELTGTLSRVPWARHADHLVLLVRYQGAWTTVSVPAPSVAKEEMNWANEPRDSVEFRRLTLPMAAVGKVGVGWAADDLMFNGALFRLAAMSGALSKVLQISVQYAKERVQFGRPIGSFQAVQQQLAVLASEAAASSAAVDAVVDALAHGPAEFAIAAAKARVGEAAHIGGRIAHQVHGAMGFTYEHPLHRSTRRLWAWRDEFGTEIDWAEWVGRAAAKATGDGLWSLLTDRSEAHI